MTGPAGPLWISGEAEEKEQESARDFPLPTVPRALSIFSIIAVFPEIPSESLCEGESGRAISMGRSLLCRAVGSMVWSCAPCSRRSDSGDGEKESEKEKNSKELVPFPFFPAFFPLRSPFQTTLQCLGLEQPGADGTA